MRCSRYQSRTIGFAHRWQQIDGHRVPWELGAGHHRRQGRRSGALQLFQRLSETALAMGPWALGHDGHDQKSGDAEPQNCVEVASVILQPLEYLSVFGPAHLVQLIIGASQRVKRLLARRRLLLQEDLATQCSKDL